MIAAADTSYCLEIEHLSEGAACRTCGDSRLCVEIEFLLSMQMQRHQAAPKFVPLKFKFRIKERRCFQRGFRLDVFKS